MKKNLTLTALSLVVVLLLAACGTSAPSNTQGENVDKQIPAMATSPINVQTAFIAPQALEPQAITVSQGNLFDNGGFENGLTGWTGCAAGAIETSGDSIEGSGALQVNPGNCFYRSAVVSPGQKISLSCNVKILSGTNWTGMGFNFTDGNFAVLSSSPTVVASTNDYVRLDAQSTAPANTQFVSMWLYSDNLAVVDNCSLLLETTPPPPPPSSGNLLENGTFASANANNQPNDWSKGCGGEYTLTGISPARKQLRLSNGACVDQGLSSGDAAALAGNTYSFSCNVFDNSIYAALTVFLDGQATSKVIPVIPAGIGTRITLTGTAPTGISGGFVSLYAEGSTKVDDCRLEAEGSTPPPPPPPSSGNLLENGTFASADANNKPNEWAKGCGGDYTLTGISPARKRLRLSDGACVDQGLSSGDVAALAGKNYSFSCNVFENTGYGALTVFLDGQATTETIPVIPAGVGPRITLTGTAPTGISGGFVSLYAEGSTKVDDCRLEVLN